MTLKKMRGDFNGVETKRTSVYLGTYIGNYSPLFQNYKPPCSKDIPVDFRVSLVKGKHQGPSGPYGAKGWYHLVSKDVAIS